MTCCQGQGLEQEFNATVARRELRQYHRKGPRKTTRLLIEVLRQEAAGKTLLDIGGGVGVIPFELLGAGVRNATGVDASSAYLQTAREEADRQGYADRTAFIHGDFVVVAAQVEAADIVTLDRVICCYPAVDALIGASAARAREAYALVYPRDTWWMAVVRAALNLFFRIRRSPMRFFVHASEQVDGAVRRHGFDVQMYRRTPMWQIAVYGRPRSAQPGTALGDRVSAVHDPA